MHTSLLFLTLILGAICQAASMAAERVGANITHDETPSVAAVVRRIEPIPVPGSNNLHYCHGKHDPDPFNSEVRVYEIGTGHDLHVIRNSSININITSVGTPFEYADKVKVTLRRHHIKHHFDIRICDEEGVACPTKDVYFEHPYSISPILRPGKFHVLAKVEKGGKKVACVKGTYKLK